jgi:hypothetical protein
MQVGEIYYWDTDKAAGHDSRFKYHLFICEPDWNTDHSFLFINKADYGGDFALSKADYDFFTIDPSYIGLGSVIPYTTDELAAVVPELKGRLSNQHMQDLFNAVLGCKKMTGSEKKLVGNALRVAF